MLPPALCLLLLLAGCEMDSYFDPSKTGRFEFTPTTVPILDRIDVIEREKDPWGKATSVTREDLLPADLTYRLAPGDLITVEVLDLLVQSQVSTSQRRIDAAGYFRLPVIGDMRAAGLTVQEFQDELVRVLDERVIRNPLVNVVLEEGAGFQYTVYGGIAGQGVYALRRADLRLLDALAQAGGVPPSIHRVYVVRQLPISEQYKFEPAKRTAPYDTYREERPPVDIESLIRQLEEGEKQPENGENDRGGVHPGMLRQEAGARTPVIDIDDLDPGQSESPQRRIEFNRPAAAPPALPAAPVTHVPPARPDVLPQQPGGSGDVFVYVEERGEWVKVRQQQPAGAESGPGGAASRTPPSDDVVLERIIEIPYDQLRDGDSSFNIVVRPSDRIYVQEPETGVVYIDGEIARPGVYGLPPDGRITLSRLVAAAGGPGPLAVPGRVDLTRMVALNREATIRVDLAAIRQRTEPDFYLKADDHIILGTDFWAVPLAVFRNGLRITYGFGFLLDRNFGNDVFGAPPTNIGSGG